MTFKSIRDLEDFDDNTPFSTGDYLAVSDADGTSTHKITAREVIETYNVQRAAEQEGLDSGPQLVEDEEGNLVNADPITAANIDNFVDPSSGLEVVRECSPSTDDEGNPITVCTKKLKIATTTEATRLIFYIWPQRAVCSKYTGSTKTNDVVTSSSVDTEDLYRNNTASGDVGRIPTEFVLFEPGVSKRTTGQDWGEHPTNGRAHPRFSLSSTVAESTNKAAIVSELGLSSDFQFGTTFAEFGSDPRMFAFLEEGYAYSALEAVDINGALIPFPASISSTEDRRDYNELKYGINTGSMNHWLYQIEFAANPYNKIVSQKAIDENRIYYLDDIDAVPGAVDYYFSSLNEIYFWIVANYGISKPAQTDINIYLKEDCIERSHGGFFVGSIFNSSAVINIHGVENQEASAAGYSTSSISMTTSGSNPNNTNAPRPNGTFERTRRSMVVCPQRFGANSLTPNGVAMRGGGYRVYSEFFNFSSLKRVGLDRIRMIFDRPSKSYNFISSRGFTEEQASYFIRYSAVDGAWMKDMDIIQIGGTIFTAIEGEAGSNIYLYHGGQKTVDGGLQTPNFNLYTNLGYGGDTFPKGILFSQESNIGTSSFDAAKVVPGFGMQFIMRAKSYCSTLIYLQNSFLKSQVYDASYMRDAKAGFNPKGPIDSVPSGINGYEAMATRLHISTDSTGGHLGMLFNVRSGSTVEFNSPITTDPQGFIHWGYKEMEFLNAVPFQVASNGQYYIDLFRTEKFNHGLVVGNAFSAIHHGQAWVKKVSAPGLFLYPHSNAVFKSFLDSTFFVVTSTIDHYDTADQTNYLKPESFTCFSNNFPPKSIFQSPHSNSGICYPIMAHGLGESRTQGELVSIWDQGTGVGGSPTAPVLRRFQVTQDTTANELWPPDHPTFYSEITGNYTLPAKFIKQQGILYNVKTGDYRIVGAYSDLVIGINEFLIFPDSSTKDFLLESQLESIEVSETTEFGRLSVNNPSTTSNVFISETLNEAAPLKKHPNTSFPTRSMFSTVY